MNIGLVKINIAEFFDSVYSEYKKIFPLSERKTIKDFKFIEKQKIIDFYKITLDELFIGFMTIIKDFNSPYIILEYFAIFSEYRNKGYGSTAIRKLKEIYKDFDGIATEVEKPHDIDSERRIEFYKKIGFKRINSEYLLFDVLYYPYILKISNKQFSDLEVINSMFQLYEKIYGVKKKNKFCKLIGKVGKEL